MPASPRRWWWSGCWRWSKRRRHQLGREKFVERVWQWKAQSGGTITQQLRRLGASLDWPRERFTMDEGLSAAVRKVFVHALPRGADLPRPAAGELGPEVLQTGDLRPRSREPSRPRVRCGTSAIRSRATGRFIVVATTRPETMLGDTAVAVHPEDERYRDLIGRHVILPLVGRRIPDRCRRIRRPGEGQRRGEDHAGARLQRLRGRAAARSAACSIILDRRHVRWLEIELRRSGSDQVRASPGMDRFDARKAIVADLEALGLLEKIEPHTTAWCRMATAAAWRSSRG